MAPLKPKAPAAGGKKDARPGTAPRPAGPVRIESAFRLADGQPRFFMTIGAGFLEDPGVRALARGEIREGGYEYPARAFLDAHLEAGDLFIDVGAHWGIFSLHAATRHRGAVKVVAIEPHPGNVAPLLRAVSANGLGGDIEIVTAAAGARAGTAPLVFNSTMGHSLHGFGLPAGARRLGAVTVPVLPLDLIVTERPALAGRRIFMKIDVEGFEPEVIEGAAGLLDSGRVAAVIWEHGCAYAGRDREQAMDRLCRSLEDRGFRQFRFPHPNMGGPLVPFAPTPECFNVFALAPGFERRPVYAKPRPHPEPLSTLTRAPAAPEVRAATTDMLIARRATDAARWADFEAMRPGAEERARRAAPLIAAGAHVLDVGAGVMALRGALAPGCRYRPADLVAFAPETVVVDLNDGQFPDGTFDVAVLLDVVEFLHDPRATLAAAAKVASRLVMSYRLASESGPACGSVPNSRSGLSPSPSPDPSAGPSPDPSANPSPNPSRGPSRGRGNGPAASAASGDAAWRRARRALGYFNDFDENALLSILDAAGWALDGRAGDDTFAIYTASRR